MPSYRDRECQWTIKDLYEKAKHPERVFVGICWQYDMQGGTDADCFIEPYPYPDQVRVVEFDYRDAKGANWGRVQASYLWQGEEYVYFSEPHMRHVEHWDELLLEMLAQCPAPKPLLSNTPQPGYTPPNHLMHPCVSQMTPRHFHVNDILLVNVHIVPHNVIPEEPFLSPILVVSCLFASSDLLHDVPQDPHIYFEGDESSYAARVWTHGWDIYNMNHPICYHMHDRTKRPMHWADSPKDSSDLGAISSDRYRYLFKMDDKIPSPEALIDIERYQMGTERSLEEYERFINVNFRARTVGAVDHWLIKDDGTRKRRPAPRVIQEWQAIQLKNWILQCIINKVPRENVFKTCMQRGLSHEYAEQIYEDYAIYYAENSTEVERTLGIEALPEVWQRWLIHNMARDWDIGTLKHVLLRKEFPKEAINAAVTMVQVSPFLSELKDTLNEVKTREWLLSMLDQQYREGNKYGKAVARIKPPTFDAFLKDYYYENIPVVLEGAATHWPAMQWTPQLLKERIGNAIIQVQFGRDADPHYERNYHKLRRDMPFDEYVNLVLATSSSNDFYMTAGNWEKSSNSLAPLQSDIGNIGDGYLNSANLHSHGYLWFGPAGTRTPLHHDLTNTLFVQLCGRKRFFLIPSHQIIYAYNNDYVYSEVDIFNLDLERFPDMKNATVMELILNPGDALLIPNAWLHAVEALDTSISMSFNGFMVSNGLPGYPGKKRY